MLSSPLLVSQTEEQKNPDELILLIAFQNTFQLRLNMENSQGLMWKA